MQPLAYQRARDSLSAELISSEVSKKVSVHSLPSILRGSMSLYAEYVKERGIDEILETSQGFATYRYLNDGATVYIVDIYVMPEFRKTGVAAHLANCIALEAVGKGCTEMLGTVAPIAKGSTESLRVLLAYGMELQSISDGLIVFRKEI